MKRYITILTLFLIVGTVDVSAQVKIGYTNPEVILSQLPEVQIVDQEIGRLLEKKDSLLAIIELELQNDFNDYNAVKDNLTQQERQQRERKLLEKNQEFEDERQNSLNEVQQMQIKMIQPIEAKIFAEIKNVADSLGLDLILNEGSVNGGAFIFYASEKQINITEMVLENLKQS